MWTRKQYMDKEVSHQEYYLEMAQLGGMYLFPDTVERTRKALADGDEHLNTIPLGYWDGLALAQKRAICKANKMRGEPHAWSLGEGVCALKALARHRAENS